MTKKELEDIDHLVAKEKGKLLGFIRKNVKRYEDAEDILQDVFYKLVNAYDKLGSIESMTGWLYKVSKNLIIDRSRKKKEVLSD